MKLKSFVGTATLLIFVTAFSYVTGTPPAVRMIAEGYPASVWPALGQFAFQGEATKPESGNTKLSEPTPRLNELFRDSSGSAMFVLKNGSKVMEFYSDGFDATTEFNSYSMVKSLVGFLVLNAVAEGKIEDLGKPLGSHLKPAQDTEAEGVSIRNLLNMTSNLVFERTNSDTTKSQAINYSPFGKLAKLHVLGPLSVLDDVQLKTSETNAFVYQNLNTALLGAMLEEIYQRPLDSLLYETIWQPAGASSFRWKKHTISGDISAYCCLYTTSQDWALVGDFLMHNGKDRDLLPPDLFAQFLGQDFLPADLLDGE